MQENAKHTTLWKRSTSAALLISPRKAQSLRYCLLVLSILATVQISGKSATTCHTPSQVNATVFKSGDWVELRWSGVQAPALDDMLALYAPADADASLSAPVKYIWAIQSPSHMASGNGSYRRFPLLC